jgi:hypothetical protein
MSISDNDLICFEDAKIKDSISNWKKPTAWSIARKLGMLVGNGAQAQINLHNFLVKEHWGTYDIRDGSMRKVASHISLREMHSDWINKTFEDTHLTLENWLLKCGARAL